MTNERALEILATLVKVPGRLRFISVAHRCLGQTCEAAREASANGKGVPSTEAERLTCEMYCAAYSDSSYSNPLADPAHYIIHDVTGINLNPKGYENRGMIEAVTAEGDRCVGYPPAVLKRVTQASNVF
jgi:hypothetical protein